MQITDGLSVAHDSYIIHRDIKPQNIMVLENGLVKITDFGIAMAMNSTQLTQTNSVMGSVHYLPPEQANGKGATLQSDIYSIGILFYELLTGKLPFKGDNAVEIALKHLKEPLPSIKDEVPNIPQSVENIIIKATAKNPKNRYADAREMHEDLKTCLDPVRVNEAKIKLKYQEISDDTKILKPIVNEDKKIEDKKSDEKIAKKITGDDLKKQNKTLIRLASIFTGLIMVVTLTYVLIMVSSKTGTVIIPDVADKKLSDAIKILQDAGFKVNDKQEGLSSKEIEIGKVVQTYPYAGTKKKKGSEIKIYISTGDATVQIEDYTGKNYNEIKGALEARGIVVNYAEEAQDADSKFKENEIVRQSVPAGTSLKKNESIILYVAKVGISYDGVILPFADVICVTVLALNPARSAAFAMLSSVNVTAVSLPSTSSTLTVTCAVSALTEASRPLTAVPTAVSIASCTPESLNPSAPTVKNVSDVESTTPLTLFAVALRYAPAVS